MNEQETIDDIIAEMFGARTEFPFVYLIGEPDTPEVLNCRNEIIEPRKINIRPVTVQELVHRFMAARKRERGCCGKLREALETALKTIRGVINSTISPRSNTVFDCRDKLSAALATPARNCDMPLVVDGPADNNADKAWFAFKRHNPDAYFDVPGLLRCIDWLLAHATEGGAK